LHLDLTCGTTHLRDKGEKMTKDEEVGQAAQPPFTKAPIATINRALRVSLVLFPIFVFCAFHYWNLYRDGELVRYGWWPLVLLLPTIGLSLHIWATTGRKINTRNEEEDFFERFQWRTSIWENPWVRYALAILLCGIVRELDIKIDNHETEVKNLATLRLSMGLLLFIAAYFAKEFVLFTLPFVLALHLFKMLPNVDKVLLIAIIVAAVGFYLEQGKIKHRAEVWKRRREERETGRRRGE
jgi:hypothetical protein